MIIVEIKGGLGNQMFQYALGKSLSINNNTEFKLDISAYIHTFGDPQRGIRMFNLDYFSTDVAVADKKELEVFSKYLKNNILGKFLRFFNKIGLYYKKTYIEEPQNNYFRFDKKLIEQKIKKDIYVTGYWQSEKYFKEYEDIIRKDLTVKTAAEGRNQEALKEMQSQNAVAIHIRHGDNANAVAKNHGVLPMDYYREAIETIRSKITGGDLMIFVFSDDMPWAKENLMAILPQEKFIFVDWNGDDKNYEDMRLMANCKHHIVANSTFSWWGAWLGKNEGQIVVAPKKYHQVGNNSYPDYYPDKWIII